MGRNGSVMAPGRSTAVSPGNSRSSMSTEWTNLRETEATVEVGLAGSTPSAGKPRTWGSGGGGGVAGPRKHFPPTHREDEDGHTTGSDRADSKDAPRTTRPLACAFARPRGTYR